LGRHQSGLGSGGVTKRPDQTERFRADDLLIRT
jgi:hypothetical protein